ncbi:trace amine-associated receptor 1 isoform X2 [Meles meles]|uniref:trace amine-associated receptor 1 isoform X2 n=1 Tax=Meles meles TaxID=9662 RepID=UPI001E69B019|nr:trace amine-associated receptor 1 isoform X2 [Meles meles]
MILAFQKKISRENNLIQRSHCKEVVSDSLARYWERRLKILIFASLAYVNCGLLEHSSGSSQQQPCWGQMQWVSSQRLFLLSVHPLLLTLAGEGLHSRKTFRYILFTY